jgi:hypothetical protein
MWTCLAGRFGRTGSKLGTTLLLGRARALIRELELPRLRRLSLSSAMDGEETRRVNSSHDPALCARDSHSY